MQLARFTVLGKPVPKARPRFDRRSGRVFTPKKSRAYEKRVAAEAHAASRWVRDEETRSLSRRADPWPDRQGCERARPRRRSDPAPSCRCDWCASSFEVELRIFFPDRRKRDIDNVAKAVLDGINGILWHDDSQVRATSISSDLSRKAPRVEVEVRRRPPAQERLSLEEPSASLFEGYSVCEDCEGVGTFKVDLPSGRRKAVVCGLCQGRGRLTA